MAYSSAADKGTRLPQTPLMAAKAGIQLDLSIWQSQRWVPAFAGTSGRGLSVFPERN